MNKEKIEKEIVGIIWKYYEGDFFLNTNIKEDLRLSNEIINLIIIDINNKFNVNIPYNYTNFTTKEIIDKVYSLIFCVNKKC